jgi:hypothetical protein
VVAEREEPFVPRRRNSVWTYRPLDRVPRIGALVDVNLPGGAYEVPLVLRDTAFDSTGNIQHKPRSGGFARSWVGHGECPMGRRQERWRDPVPFFELILPRRGAEVADIRKPERPRHWSARHGGMGRGLAVGVVWPSAR